MRRRPSERLSANQRSMIAGIAMTGLAVGVAVLIVVLSVMNGFQKEVSDRMLKATHIPEAAAAHESPASMRVALVVSAVAVVGLGLLPGVMATASVPLRMDLLGFVASSQAISFSKATSSGCRAFSA